MQAGIKSKMCRLGHFYLPSLFTLLINVSISRIGLCTRKYQRCSLTFTLITQFICKISKEYIKSKQNSSASSNAFSCFTFISYVSLRRWIDTLVYPQNGKRFFGFKRQRLNLISELGELICAKNVLSHEHLISDVD